MILAAGTSGYCYKEWRGHFYPEKMPESDMLGYYAARLSTVEINNTFYRMPSPKVLAEWATHVPEDFTFTLKAPRRITHEKRLHDCAEHLAALIERSGTLGARLGPLLFQLPPFLKKDVPRLVDFLALIPAGRPVAFEFRNASWQDDEVHAALRSHGAMLCVTDTDEGDTPFVVTAATAYVRLRRTHYDDADLRGWAERIASQRLERTYVYFMHEDEALGTKFAQRLNEIWKAIVPSPASR
jgi:uncharacterized protein YecE (DUF72 family)